MAQIALDAQKMARALEAQKDAPDSDNPLKPAAAVLSSYTAAIDSVSWSSVFITLSLISVLLYQVGLTSRILGIAESLRTSISQLSSSF